MREILRIVLLQVFLAFICLLGALFMVFVYAPQEGLVFSLSDMWLTLFLGFIGMEVFLAICAAFFVFVLLPLMDTDKNGNIFLT